MGDLLTSAMFKLQDWPKDKTPEGAITQLTEIEGRRTRARLYKGEPILENRLFPKGTSQQGASAMITKGYRIVPVKVDSVSGGGSLILPGDHVDVMVHFVRDTSREIKETVTRTILQNVKVFAVDDVVDFEKDKQGGKTINAKTISLLVTPKEASIVMLASQMGMVNLVMRGPDVEEQSENVETRPSELFTGALASQRIKDEPAPPPRVTEPVLPVAPPSADKAKVRPTWTIRVIGANAVNEVKYEQDPTSGTASPEWKLVSATGGSPEVQPIKVPPSAMPPSAATPSAMPPGPLGPLEDLLK
jgi:pilus assembly protein CpaB